MKILSNIILQTKRLAVVMPTLNSLNNWCKLLSDIDVMKYVGDGKPRDKKKIKTVLLEAIKHFEKYGFSLFDIYEKNSNEFIGEAGLIYLAFNQNNEEIEVSYTFHKKYWNKGYATELTQALIQWGFNKFHLEKIVGCCNPKNKASINVLEKCGMKYHGKYLYDGKHKCNIYTIYASYGSEN